MNDEARTYHYEENQLGSFLRDMEIGLRYSLVRDSDGVVCGYFKREETAAEVVAALNAVAAEPAL